MTNSEFYLRAIISMAGNSKFVDENGILKYEYIFEQAGELEDEVFNRNPDRFENMEEGYSSEVAKLLDRIGDILDDKL